MTTVQPHTVNGSSWPRGLDQLLPDARRLTAELGEIPPRNRLMREYRIGAPKADALRAELAVPAPLPDPVAPEPVPLAVPDPAPAAPQPSEQVASVGHPGTRPPAVWPVVLLALPAFVAIWSGWVGLGGLTGFGVVHPLPGIWDSASLDTAITLPIGVETYGAYALYVWLSGRVPDRARRFARWSAIAALTVGALGQIAYHLLVAPPTGAPWWITTAVSVLPVAVLGMGAALAHLVRSED